MLNRRAKRLLTLACIALAALTVTVAGAGHAFAAEVVEAKPPLLPPLTGEGSAQTYMQAIWVIIVFVLLLAILYPTAWKNVLNGLKAREARIRRDIADAEGARVKAEASLVEYNKQLATAETQVRELLGKAVADAERIAAGIKTRAQEETEAAKERATAEIEASKQQALSEIYEQAANLATSVAAKILRREITAGDQKSLVDETLRQMQSAGA